MEVSTLTKKQMKSTLSVKKSKTKEVIKNVLSTPYKNTFWPELSDEEQIKIRIILEKNLPQVKVEKINIPWNEIKNVPKRDRKTFRIEYAKKLNLHHSNNCERQGLVLGINDVTKSLERNSLSIVLLSNDVHPRLMVQHIIDMTVMKKIPILVVGNLRKLTKVYCGISSVALGIEKNLTENSTLLEIVNSVEQIFNNISPPKDHINFNRSLLDNTEPMQIEEDKDTINVENLTEKISNEEQIRNIYLSVNGNNERVFIPEAKKKSAISEILTMEVSTLPIQVQEKKLTKYKPLKVKRLKNDSSRSKKKIKSLKKS